MVENNELYEKLARLSRLMKRKRIVESRQNNLRFDPLLGQGRILATLKIQDGVSTKTLAYILGISIPTLNEALAKLAKGGFIERRPAENDKRISLNYLTELGKSAAPDLTEDDDELDFLSCLNDEEQATLSDYVDRINTSLEETLGSRGEQNCHRRGHGPHRGMGGPEGPGSFNRGPHGPYGQRGFGRHHNRCHHHRPEFVW